MEDKRKKLKEIKIIVESCVPLNYHENLMVMRCIGKLTEYKGIRFKTLIYEPRVVKTMT